jgi:organic radical activating enzyme
MHLVEILSRRPVPGAAVALSLTRRCPLRCRHCSTDSGPSSEEHAASLFERFVTTFTAADRPEFLLLTGGEPLLRPHLVTSLAAMARAVGTRTYVLSGMFFARQRRVSRSVRQAIDAVDHLSASLDFFHEEQVPRDAVLLALRSLVEQGKDVSLQVVGSGDDDPYLAEVTAQARRALGDRVPMLVGRLATAGRARSWNQRLVSTRPPAGTSSLLAADPCTMAAWPVVGFDGTVTACGNQDVVDHEPLPAHLRLGHVSVDSWSTIQQRCVSSPILRGLRVFGPLYLAGPGGPAGYCAACWRLSGAAEAASTLAKRAAVGVLEERVTALQIGAGAVGFARRYGCARYAGLVLLGYRDRKPVQVS